MARHTSTSLSLPVALRQRWWVIVVVEAAAVFLVYRMLVRHWSAEAASMWLWAASAAHLYVLAYVRLHLHENHRPEEDRILSRLGPGNGVTLVRGLLAGLLGGFVLLPRPPGWVGWMPGLLFLAIALADFWDGYLARRSNHATRLGEKMDVTFDALAIFLASVLVVGYGQVPPWYLAVGLAYYVFIAATAVRHGLGRPLYSLPPSPYRRMVGGFLFGYLVVVLFPVFEPPGTVVAGVLFGLPVVFSFVRDWLVVAGWVDASSPRYRRGMQGLKALLLDWLPVAVRTCGVIGAGWWLVQSAWGVDGWSGRLAQQGVASPGLWTLLLGLLGVAGAVGVGAGIAGRLAALALLTTVCVDLLLRGYTSLNGFVLACSIIVMLLGTGAFSRWQPEDALLLRRAGERLPGAPRAAVPGGSLPKAA